MLSRFHAPLCLATLVHRPLHFGHRLQPANLQEQGGQANARWHLARVARAQHYHRHFANKASVPRSQNQPHACPWKPKQAFSKLSVTHRYHAGHLIR